MVWGVIFELDIPTLSSDLLTNAARRRQPAQLSSRADGQARARIGGGITARGGTAILAESGSTITA